MALIFTDGCENDITTDKWNSITGTVNFDPTGGVITNTGALSFPSGSFGTNMIAKRFKQVSIGGRFEPASENVTLRTSLWVKFTQAITTISPFLNWREYYNPDNAVLSIGTDGLLQISNWYPYSNAGYRTYYPTAMTRIDDNKWHHIEVALYYIGTASGQLDVSVDGSSVLKRSGANLSGGSSVPTLITDFYISCVNNGTMYIDDVMLWDDKSSVNAFQSAKGPTKIYTIRPSADTTWANSTPSSGGTRYNLINEKRANFSNLVTVPTNTVDMFEFTDLPEDGSIEGQIFALNAHIFFSSNTTGKSSNLTLSLVQSSPTVTRNDTKYTTLQSNAYGTPILSTPFVIGSLTANSVNALKFGYEVLP